MKHTKKHHSNNYNHRSYNPRNNIIRHTYNAPNQAYAIDTYKAGDNDDVEQQVHMIQHPKRFYKLPLLNLWVSNPSDI